MDMHRVPINELAKSCAHSSDSDEWEELLRRCIPVAARVASRVARLWKGVASASIVDDIVQEIFLKLCEQERRILREFHPQGEDSFFGLLRIVSVSVANDYFRRHNSIKRGGKTVIVTMDGENTVASQEGGDGPREMQRSVLYVEIDLKMRSAPDVVPERDRVIFWLFYMQGLTAEEIAALPATGLTAKGVESALRRVTHWLRKWLASSKAVCHLIATEDVG